MKKRVSLLTAILFCVFLLCFGVWFWILPDQEISLEENRPLQTLPAVRLSRVFSGRFSEELSTYYADQFPLRDAFVEGKAGLELLLGKGENNGILVGEDGQLAKRLFSLSPTNGAFAVATDAYSKDALSQKTSAIKALSERIEIPLTVLLPPRAIDVAASSFSYPGEASRELLLQLQGELSEVDCAEVAEKLSKAFDAGEYVVYNTDHHWTSLGAYYAYREVMRSFGMEEEILPLESFEREVVSTGFFGTLASASGMRFLAPDSVELFHFAGEDDYQVLADGKELDGFYTREALAKKDHYAVFLDGTHDVVTIKKQSGEERPLLLVAKDSFANSIAPFLAIHFDLVLLNLSSTRADFTDLSAAVEQYDPDRLLLVYSLENLLTSDRILTLR